MSALLLADAKSHLNITSDGSDTKLQDIIDAAEATLSNQVGPLEVGSFTDVVVNPGPTLVLSQYPVVSVASVSGSLSGALDSSTYVLDSAAGVVRISSARWLTSQDYTVTYTAGWSTVPADLLLAVKEMVRHLWSSQRGGTRGPAAPADPSMPGYLIPNMVASLIEPYRVPGIA